MNIEELAEQAGFRKGHAHYPLDCDFDKLAAFAALVSAEVTKQLKTENAELKIELLATEDTHNAELTGAARMINHEEWRLLRRPC